VSKSRTRQTHRQISLIGFASYPRPTPGQRRHPGPLRSDLDTWTKAGVPVWTAPHRAGERQRTLNQEWAAMLELNTVPFADRVSPPAVPTQQTDTHETVRSYFRSDCSVNGWNRQTIAAPPDLVPTPFHSTSLNPKLIQTFESGLKLHRRIPGHTFGISRLSTANRHGAGQTCKALCMRPGGLHLSACRWRHRLDTVASTRHRPFSN
jgi:hypothetical protein